MNLNSVYKIKESEAYFYIKRIADKNSIDLAIFSDFDDFYITKKTLFNCMSVLSYNGTLIIKSKIDRIDKIISLLEYLDYNHFIYCCSPGIQKNNSLSTGIETEFFVIINQSQISKPRSVVLFDKTIEQHIVDKFSNVQNTVLIIGSLNTEVALCCKNLCRYVICIMEHVNNKLFGEAIREYEV